MHRFVGSLVRQSALNMNWLARFLYGLLQEAERCVAQFRDRTELKG
jgi:hypothetical protein